MQWLHLQPKKSHTTWLSTITYSDFGTNHHVKYPTAFICSNCDLWDQRDATNVRLNHEMNKYKCAAQHSALDNNPQQQQTGYFDAPWTRWWIDPSQPNSPPRPIRKLSEVAEEEQPERGKNDTQNFCGVRWNNNNNKDMKTWSWATNYEAQIVR